MKEGTVISTEILDTFDHLCRFISAAVNLVASLNSFLSEVLEAQLLNSLPATKDRSRLNRHVVPV